MAHSRKIKAPLCDCGKKATVEVYSCRNERYGPKCSSCGARLVKSLNAEESWAAPTTGEGETGG
jgi:hypothetical protein